MQLERGKNLQVVRDTVVLTAFRATLDSGGDYSATSFAALVQRLGFAKLDSKSTRAAALARIGR